MRLFQRYLVLFLDGFVLPVRLSSSSVIFPSASVWNPLFLPLPHLVQAGSRLSGQLKWSFARRRWLKASLISVHLITIHSNLSHQSRGQRALNMEERTPLMTDAVLNCRQQIQETNCFNCLFDSKTIRRRKNDLKTNRWFKCKIIFFSLMMEKHKQNSANEMFKLLLSITDTLRGKHC